MKRGIIAFTVLSISVYLATQVWAHGIGRRSMGGHLGTFPGGFGHHRPHSGFGLRLRGFGHSNHFRHAHGIPLGRAASSCLLVGSRFIFFGF